MGRPPHVRAGSALALLGDAWVVVQDDALFLAHVARGTGTVTHLALPASPGAPRTFSEAEGTKALKPDFEAACRVGAGLLILGSGSTGARERVVLWTPGESPQLINAAPFYAALRSTASFSGSELNLEGAASQGDSLWLFNRGNGAPRGTTLPVDATGRLPLSATLDALRTGRSPPALTDITVWDLGSLRGARLGFTDAAALPDGRLLFVAAAEDSPDSYRDGQVSGSVLGVLEEGKGRWTPICDAEGGDLPIKCEGVALDPESPHTAWLVVDADDPEVPADLLQVELTGF